ncbi:MAG: DUF4270 domain-containing protein [Flavobacteriaceae bacterium]
MKFLHRPFLWMIFGLCLVCYQCQPDYHNVSGELFDGEAFENEIAAFPAYAYQHQINNFQSNNLPVAQLGRFNDPLMGETEAIFVSQVSLLADANFGILSPENEADTSGETVTYIDEQETVTEVFLEIPFFNNLDDADNDGVIDAFDIDSEDPQSDTDQDGVSDILETQAGLNPLSPDSDNDGILDDVDEDNSSYDAENKVYEIDSIFGNRDASFRMGVHELTYYLSPLDPFNNFETQSIYYSDRNFLQEGFVGTTLYNETTRLNLEELRFNYTEDDEETDEDETTLVETRLTPRIRIPLEPSFFQTRILDQEGESVLTDPSAFQRHIRGLLIEIDPGNENLYMLLDANSATVKINYTYRRVNQNGTTDDTSDDTIDIENATETLSLGGVRFNTVINGQGQANVAAQSDESTAQIFLNGGAFMGRLRLFDDENPNDNETLSRLRSDSWLINEASLSFYVDPDNPVSLQAPRLHLYRYDNGLPLVDHTIDQSENEDGRKVIYSGLLEYNDAGEPWRYRFRITDHISDIIRRDSTNIDIGLMITSDIQNTSTHRINLSTNESRSIPQSALLSPHKTVLVGQASNTLDSPFALEIKYISF